MDALIIAIVVWFLSQVGLMFIHSVERVHGDKIDEIVKSLPKKIQSGTKTTAHNLRSSLVFLFFQGYRIIWTLWITPSALVGHSIPYFRKPISIKEYVKPHTLKQWLVVIHIVYYQAWRELLYLYSKRWWNDVKYVISFARLGDAFLTARGRVDVDHLRQRIEHFRFSQIIDPNFHIQLSRTMSKPEKQLMTDGEVVEYVSLHFDELHAQYLKLFSTNGKGAFVYLREAGTNKCDVTKGRFLTANDINKYYNYKGAIRTESIDVMLLRCDNKINIPILFATIDGTPSDIVLVKKAQA